MWSTVCWARTVTCCKQDLQKSQSNGNFRGSFRTYKWHQLDTDRRRLNVRYRRKWTFIIDPTHPTPVATDPTPPSTASKSSHHCPRALHSRAFPPRLCRRTGCPPRPTRRRCIVTSEGARKHRRENSLSLNAFHGLMMRFSASHTRENTQGLISRDNNHKECQDIYLGTKKSKHTTEY